MGQLLRLPLDETVFARLTQRERDANISEENAELLATAVDVLHDWERYEPKTVRAAITTANRIGDGYAVQMADKVQYQLNMREIQARNRQKILIPREPDEPLWRDVIAGGVAVVAFGWAVLTLVMGAL